MDLASNAHNLIDLAALAIELLATLSWSLILDVEGRWPWQREEKHGRGTAAGPGDVS
jgi:hypothetical protein